MKKRWILTALMVIIFSFLAQEAECGITLKALVVNPSKTKTQTAQLKAYLPKEASADDVIDLGDLKIDYDIEKGLYFVHQKYKLKPGESISREIEIKDVWVISKAEIDDLTRQAADLAERLKGTAYFNMAVTLQKDIESKAEEIMNRQEKALNANPRAHIGAYRSNMNTLDETTASLAKLEKMVEELQEDKGSGSEKIHVKATWRLIVAMVVALGVLSFIFFVIWNRQAAVEGAKRKAEQGDKKISF